MRNAPPYMSHQTYREHCFGIFVLACVTLAYQILITRFFSVVLHYHFAFFGISLAMLGMTGGAISVHRNPARYSAGRVAAEFSRHATLFAISSVAVVIAFLCAPLVLPAAFAMKGLMLMVVLFFIPFAHSGICISLLLTRSPARSGFLYASDLTGAAIGCLVIIAILFLVDPFSATLCLAALAAGSGWIIVRGSGESKLKRLSGVTCVLLAAAAALHIGIYLSGLRHIGVFWAKGAIQSETLYERWNTYSRVRVRPMGSDAPFGWGMVHKPAASVEQKFLDIDADAGTVITRFDGDLSKLAYLRNDVINSAYFAKPVNSAAVIGVGGGRDILSALYFGAKRVVGVEINPAIFDVLTNRFAAFSGHLDRQPGVALVNAEARSYINHSPESYDLIQISLIDTWAATAAGGLTLTENRLYTVEAWDDFFRKLNPGGMLSVSRWYDPVSHRAEFYRLVAIAAKALSDSGVADSELSQHVIALRGNRIVTVMVSPSPFTAPEWQSVRQAAMDQGFELMLGPGVPFDSVAAALLSGTADAAFYSAQPDNIAPSTDDQPFFFYTARFGDLLTSDRIGPSPAANNLALVTLTLATIITGLVLGIVLIAPFTIPARYGAGWSLAASIVYFCAIGIAFMLIEISQMQRLMIFLGHPVYGLSVVLFTLLFFGGIGSYTVGRGAPKSSMVAVRAVGLLLAIVAVGYWTPFITEAAKSYTTGLRVVVSVLSLAPVALFMGMMFPLGLSLCRDQQSRLLPYLWGVNGAASVFASVAGVVISMELGIKETYFYGCIGYLVCITALPAMIGGAALWREKGAEAVGKIPI